MLPTLATDIGGSGALGSVGAAGFFAMAAGIIIVVLLVQLALYIYTSFAFMSIGKKAKDSLYGLAWIPGLGPALIAFRASGMHWWPWLLLIGFVIPLLNILAMLAFFVFVIIWSWKMFEKIKRPGWYALLMLIPLVNLVIIGIAAWTKP